MIPQDYPILLWPAAASASATQTDHLILGFTLLTLALVMPIFVGFTLFAIVYRDGRKANRDHRRLSRDGAIELSWMLIPFLLTLFFFVWGARLFDDHRHPPAGAMEIDAIGRQWMWKFEHPGGQGEINNLHVPTDQPVLIRMISQDVIHALYVPALRIQMETLPDRYTELWFTANRTGIYRLYCSEYCGTDHSAMGGTITVMTPADYQAWLTQAGSDQSLAASGKALFASYGCGGCHEGQSTVRAPSLAGLYGAPVPLQGGGTIIADDTYLRSKIVNPDQNPIAGYKQVMPSFRNLIPEENLLRIIAYLKASNTAEPAP